MTQATPGSRTLNPRGITAATGWGSGTYRVTWTETPHCTPCRFELLNHAPVKENG